MTMMDLVGDPGCVRRTIGVRDGSELVFRLVTREDAAPLGRYFEGLSEDTRRRYGPHALSAEAARRLCAEIDYGKTMRFLAEADGDIVAYFIVAVGFLNQDEARYRNYAMGLDCACTCTLAPSVADDWQNRGLGSSLMRELIPMMRKLGFRWMVLWGGTLAANERAVHFYRKFGFQHAGVFQTVAGGASVDNYDMVLDLGAEDSGASGASEGLDT